MNSLGHGQIMVGPRRHSEDLEAESLPPAWLQAALDPRPSQRSHWEADEIFLRVGSPASSSRLA